MSIIASGGHDHSPDRKSGEGGQVGSEIADRRGIFHFHQVVIDASSHPFQRRSKGFCESVGCRGFQGGSGGKVHFNAAISMPADQFPAFFGEEPCGALPGEGSRFPKEMGAGQGGMSAKGHLGGRGEPAQPPSRVSGHKKGGLRKIYFGGDPLHPTRFRRGIQKTNGGGIAGEWLGGKGIDAPDDGSIHPWVGNRIQTP